MCTTCHWTCYLVDATLVLGGYNYKVAVFLRVHTFVFVMMSQLIANKGIIRSYSMRQRRIDAAAKLPVGIIPNCDVCGGLMFNTHKRCLFCPFTDLVSL